MDRFVNQQNIARYRKLASEATDATQRQQIMRLLADEEAKFKLDQAAGDVDNTRQP
jgi:hypothetical protein